MNSHVTSKLQIKQSPGLKFFLLAILALVLSIPGLLIDNMAEDRAAARNAMDHWQGNQWVQARPTTVLGIHLVDSYRSTTRSLKYITLFLGLVFLTYFIFEISTEKRVHPAQYLLIGIVQIIFYLLLLSLAEHVSFDLAFLIAASATVSLFTLYVQWTFQSRKHARRAAVVFATLYASIYALLRLDNYALMIGSFASFATVAATMYFTRNLDWYHVGVASAPAATSLRTERDSWLE